MKKLERRSQTLIAIFMASAVTLGIFSLFTPFSVGLALFITFVSGDIVIEMKGAARSKETSGTDAFGETAGIFFSSMGILGFVLAVAAAHRSLSPEQAIPIFAGFLFVCFVAEIVVEIFVFSFGSPEPSARAK